METLCLQAGIVAVTVSLFAYVLRVATPWRMQPVGWAAMLIGWLCLIASLVFRSMNAQYFALSNMYESMLVLILWVQVAFLVVDIKYRLPAIAWPAALLILTALGYNTTLSQDILPLQAALQSYWRSIHVPVIILSYAMFTLAFVVAVVRLIKPQSAPALHSGEIVSLPGWKPTNLYDDLIYRLILIGFPLLTIGIILGGLWANEAWGNYWSWDPKESMSLVTLLGYGVYLHLRVNGSHSPRTLAWVSVVGFGLMLVTYFGVNLMGLGLHSYGKIG
jgi:cytochrome c-type biogenesis protein CcsB